MHQLLTAAAQIRAVALRNLLAAALNDLTAAATLSFALASRSSSGHGDRHLALILILAAVDVASASASVNLAFGDLWLPCLAAVNRQQHADGKGSAAVASPPYSALAASTGTGRSRGMGKGSGSDDSDEEPYLSQHASISTGNGQFLEREISEDWSAEQVESVPHPWRSGASSRLSPGGMGPGQGGQRAGRSLLLLDEADGLSADERDDLGAPLLQPTGPVAESV